MKRSYVGYQMLVAGLADRAARYAGFSNSRTIWIGMLAGGAAAGLAGVGEVAGPLGQMFPTASPGYGFAAIIVAFLGRLNPIGIVLAGLLMSLGFEHNKQSLRIVNVLEKRYPEFDGLNLTWEVQEGMSKHSRDADNPLLREKAHRYPSLEGQVADFADGIAYNAHDLDDGITSNLLDIDQLQEVALWQENEKLLEQKYANLDFELKKYQIVRRIINDLITDFRKTTQENIEQYGIRSVSDVRTCQKRVAGFSKEVAEKNNELKKFLYKNMYHHRRVRRMEFKAELYLTELFNAYTRIPPLLPESVLANEPQGPLPRRICDYISGMTDRSSIDEYRKLFSPDEKD